MSGPDLKQDHVASSQHRSRVDASAMCGCFYCRSTFAPSEIEEWIDDDQTAMCPKCGIDSVIGDASGLPVGDKDFLTAMNRHWF